MQRRAGLADCTLAPDARQMAREHAKVFQVRMFRTTASRETVLGNTSEFNSLLTRDPNPDPRVPFLPKSLCHKEFRYGNKYPTETAG